MEGPLLAVHVTEGGGKKPWHTDYVKFDDISAQLMGFTDRSLAELRWKLHVKDADVATPVPGDRKHDHAPNVDEMPHCLYVHEVTSCGQEIIVFLAAPDDATKKKWMKCLLQGAKEGPHPPRFSSAVSPRVSSGSRAKPLPPYCFAARVTQVRLHSGGKHAEYMVTCHVSVFSRVADRRLSKEWNVWHRFSEFDGLNEALKLSLGAEKMADVPFFKTHRDAVRSLFGWWSLDQDFLDHRRLLLDTFMCRLCAIDGITDFFQHHSSEQLKVFLEFDDHCDDVDRPRKVSKPTSPSKHDELDSARRCENLRTSDMSPRDSDNTSASFSSAVMSPIAAPAAVSPAKEEATNSLDAFQTEAEDDQKSPTKTGKSPRRNSRKKGKGKEPKTTTKESCAEAVVASETEAIRLPAPTKKGKKKN